MANNKIVDCPTDGRIEIDLFTQVRMLLWLRSIRPDLTARNDADVVSSFDAVPFFDVVSSFAVASFLVSFDAVSFVDTVSIGAVPFDAVSFFDTVTFDAVSFDVVPFFDVAVATGPSRPSIRSSRWARTKSLKSLVVKCLALLTCWSRFDETVSVEIKK
jgi:hypothetical protein